MALPSQFRDTASRQKYMTSRRRRRSKWPWVTALIVIVVAIVYAKQRLESPVQTVAAPSQTSPQPPEPAKAVSVEVPKSAPGSQPPVKRQTSNQSRQQTQPVPKPTLPLKKTRASEPKKASREKASPALTSSGKVAANLRLIATNPIEARQRLSASLEGPPLTPADADQIRRKLSELNHDLIFSKAIVADDPFVTTFVVQTGDRLIKIAPQYAISYQFIERINKVSGRLIQVGQRLKVVQGPFHVVVDKSDFRLDVYLGAPGADRVFVRSFSVGLGAEDSTPIGNWVVRPKSKVVNPAWANPRSGIPYKRDDPNNPIGERWIGLRGTDPQTELVRGIGIHGTIEPQTIGRQSSMGCVRMHAEDVALLFDMLVEKKSTVLIRP